MTARKTTNKRKNKFTNKTRKTINKYKKSRSYKKVKKTKLHKRKTLKNNKIQKGGILGRLIGDGIGMVVGRITSKGRIKRQEKKLLEQLKKCKDEQKELTIKLNEKIQNQQNKENINIKGGGGDLAANLLIARGEDKIIRHDDKRKYLRNLLEKCEKNNFDIRKQLERFK